MEHQQAIDLAASLKDTLTTLLPTAYVWVYAQRCLGGNGQYNVYLHFASCPTWANGIIHNDPAHTIVMLTGTTEKAELGRASQSYKIKRAGLNNIREKRGTLAQATQALVNYFTKYGPELVKLEK